MRLPDLLRGTSFRLAIVHAVLFALSVTVLFGVVYWSTASSIAEQLDEEIEAELVSLVSEASAEGVQGVADTIARRMDGGSPGEHLLLQDARGNRIVGNLSAIPMRSGWFNILPDRDPATGHRHKEHVIRAKAKLLDDGTFIVFGRDTYPLRELREIIVRGFTVCLTATITLALGIGAMMSASVLRRVTKINVAAREIMQGDLSRRVSREGANDEFNELAGQINTMLDRIQSLVEDLQQVTNDIAHDLRTPLTRLRQKLEAAKVRATSAAKYELAIDRAIEDSDCVLQTFTAMLRIAQIDSGTRRAGFDVVDLSRLLDGLVDIYKPVAEDAGHLLDGRIPPGKRVNGDRELLTQLFANLIENSIKHTPQGTKVDVTLDHENSHVVAQVADNGPGVPGDMREHVFKRFVRLEKSRTSMGGGLGLSLVAAIAGLHDIRIELGDNQPGLLVSLSFPERA